MTCVATAWQHVICVTDVLDPSRSYLLRDWWNCSLSTSHASEWQKHRLTTAPKPILRRINRSSAQYMQGKPPIMLSHNPAVTMWILLHCILYIPLDNLHKPLNHPNCVVAWSPPRTIPTAKPPPGLRDPESRLGMVCLGHSSALKVLTPKSCCDMLCKPLLVVQQMKHTAELQTRLLGETIVGLSWHCWMLTVTERSIQPSQHLVKPK